MKAKPWKNSHKIWMNNIIFAFGGFGLWCLMPLSTIFVLSWQSVLLMEKTRVPRENHWPVAITDKLDQIMLYWVHSAMSSIWIHNFKESSNVGGLCVGDLC